MAVKISNSRARTHNMTPKSSKTYGDVVGPMLWTDKRFRSMYEGFDGRWVWASSLLIIASQTLEEPGEICRTG